MSSGGSVSVDRIERIHNAAVVIDTHCDTILRVDEAGFDFMSRNLTGHVDYPRIREGGLDAVVMAVYLGKAERTGELVEKALDRIGRIRSLADENASSLEVACSAQEILRIKAEGKTALVIGIEGGHIIDGSLHVLNEFYRKEVRVMTLTHTFHNELADSAGFGEELAPLHGGLSAFGRDAVREMNRLGMVVDVSHVSDDTLRHVLDVSEAPVIASHSGCRSLCDHPRNISDEMIRAMAARGGVIQIVFFNGFIDPEYKRKTGAVKKRREPLEARAKEKHPEGSEDLVKELFRIWRENPPEGTPLSLLLDHIDHVIDLVGPDHVGLGSDWDGIPTTVDGVEDCSKLPNITKGLFERGHDEESVRKILGGNFLRVFRETASRRAE